MACSTEEIKKDSLNKVRSIIKGKSTKVVSFTKKGDVLITPSKDSNKVKTKANARKMAEAKIKKINEWSEKTFKTDAYTGQWASIYESPSDFRLELTFPKGLEALYRKKEAIEEAREVQMQDAQRAGINEDNYNDDYGFDYMPSSADGYNYGTYLENKKNMRNYVSQRINVLEESPNKTKTDLEQIEELKEVKRRLNKDLANLENEVAVLDNFFNYFNNDLTTIEEILLENPSLDNLMASRNFIDNMKFIFNNEMEKNFNDVHWQKLKDTNPEEHKLFENFFNRFNTISDKLKDTEIEFTHKHVQATLNGNAQDEEINEETKKLVEQVKNIDSLSKYLLPIDGSSEASPLQLFVRKVYDDATTGKSETYNLRNNLLNIQDKLEKRLLELGYKNNQSFIGGLGSMVVYDIFKKGNRLINKFSQDWNNFKSEVTDDLDIIQDLVYTKADFAEVKKERRKLFDKLKNDVKFLDVRKIPEFIERDDLQGNFGTFFKPEEAEAHKEEIIQSLIGESGNRKVAEKVYDKMVQEQLAKIHSFEISQEQYKKRLLKKNNVDTIQELSEKDKNNLLTKYYTESPFAFAENYEVTGKSDVAKIYFHEGEQRQAFEPSTLEYLSYIPSKGEYFDSDFDSKIETDETLLDAWEMFEEGYEYINKNRKYQKDGETHNTNDLTSQVDMIHEHNTGVRSLAKYMGKKAKDFIYNVLTTTQFVPADKVNLRSGESIRTLDESIETQLKPILATIKVKKLPLKTPLSKDVLSNENKEYLENIIGKELPPNFIIEGLVRNAIKQKVLNKQNLNMIDVLTSQLEMVEKFKAKKEIETILLFAKNQIDRVEKSANNDKHDASRIVTSFINKHLYGVNNRANWVSNKQGEKHFGRLFSSNEKETVAELKKAINLIKELSKNSSDKVKEQAQKDIEEMEGIIESKGRVLTTGSVFELFAMRTAILVGLGLNLPSQMKNIFMGNVSGRQNDGIEWTEGNYVTAASYTRKWKIAKRKLSNREKAKYQLTNTLIDGLGVFQNSANELDRIKESSYKNNIGKFISNPLHIVGETEKTIQRPQILSILGDVDIADKDGNIVKAFNTQDTNNPHPAFQLDNDGNLTLKPEFDTEQNRATWINRNSQEYADLFGESGKVPKTIAKINGDYRSTSSTLVKETSIGSLAMMFKTWLPAFVLRRYGKKDGIISGLAESGRVNEATAVTMLTATMYAGIGASVLVSPIVGIGLTAAYLGHRKHKKLIAQEGEYFKTLLSEIQKSITSLQFATDTLKFGGNAIRFTGAVGAKFAQQSTDLVFGKRYLSNDIINQIAGFEQKEGEDNIDYQKNKARLQFLLTEASTTATLLMLKILANMMLFPDDDDEKNFKKISADEWYKPDLFEKAQKDPRTTAYYALENLITGMGNDMNFMNDPNAFAETALNGTASSFVTNWGKLLSSPLEQWMKGDLKSGPNKGRNRMTVNLQKAFVPRGLTDFTLGFSNIARQDYQPKDFVNSIYISDFKKMESERKTQYQKSKEQWIEYYKQYPNYSDEEIEKKATKRAKKEHPTIKKNFNEAGDVIPYRYQKVQQYD